jgi:GTP-binding protein HflX
VQGRGGNALGKVTGDTHGLKASEQKALERLYRRRVDPSRVTTYDLVRELAARSHALRRRIGVLIDRGGQVTHVFVGDRKSLEIPPLGRFRRGGERLKGLRWLATTLRGEEPTRSDLNALVRYRLDLLVLIGVGDDGEPSFRRDVHLTPACDDGSGVHQIWGVLAPTAGIEDFGVFLQELEAKFEAATPTARATGGERATRALLAVVTTSGRDAIRAELEELRELAGAAGLDVRGEISQRRSRFDPRTLMGSGRVADLSALALTANAELVVFNHDLAPRQQVALEDLLGLRVIDRTQLILDIFADRARTHAGKLQVEAARLRYMLPRLLGKGAALSRVGGGKGAGFGRTKGSGEKKLEIDRRRIRERIATLDKELDKLKRQRGLRRARRNKNRLPHVALVGYTNVGKSTLFNRLTDATVLEEDAMFSSLDPTLRQRRLPSGRRVVFSDSVGFIRRLPRDLVQAFGATLDELEDAALVVHVSDASDAKALDRVEAVRELLRELGRGDIPELLVFNKIDAVEDADTFRPLANSVGDAPLLISAKGGAVEQILDRVEAALA